MCLWIFLTLGLLSDLLSAVRLQLTVDLALVQEPEITGKPINHGREAQTRYAIKTDERRDWQGHSVTFPEGPDEATPNVRRGEIQETHMRPLNGLRLSLGGGSLIVTSGKTGEECPSPDRSIVHSIFNPGWIQDCLNPLLCDLESDRVNYSQIKFVNSLE